METIELPDGLSLRRDGAVRWTLAGRTGLLGRLRTGLDAPALRRWTQSPSERWSEGAARYDRLRPHLVARLGRHGGAMLVLSRHSETPGKLRVTHVNAGAVATPDVRGVVLFEASRTDVDDPGLTDATALTRWFWETLNPAMGHRWIAPGVLRRHVTPDRDDPRVRLILALAAAPLLRRGSETRITIEIPPLGEEGRGGGVHVVKGGIPHAAWDLLDAFALSSSKVVRFPGERRHDVLTRHLLDSTRHEFALADLSAQERAALLRLEPEALATLERLRPRLQDGG